MDLLPCIVMLGDPRWRGCLAELRRARWVSVDTEFYDGAAAPAIESMPCMRPSTIFLPASNRSVRASDVNVSIMFEIP